MPESYTCIECENLYDWTDGDLNERMCNNCLDKLYGDGEPTTADEHNKEEPKEKATCQNTSLKKAKK